MSARPDVPRLSDEELDLLISRFLDGDLSPEEAERFDRLVALDPASARRRDELAALVAEVKALPEPAAPFALTTRVTSNVAERAGRPGSLGARVGFFPAPGFAKAALAILVIVGASIAILRPAPRRVAEGPVDVLLYDALRPAAPEPKNSAAEPGAEKRDARLKDLSKTKAFAQEADKRQVGGKAQSEEIASIDTTDKKESGKLENARRNEVASAADAAAVAQAAPKQRSDRDEVAALDGAREQAPSARISSSGNLAASAPAPAVPAAPAAAPVAEKAAGAPARDREYAVTRGWTVSVRGAAGRLWSLRRAPDNPPPAHGSAVYRVTLDASGAVTALSRVSAGPADPRLDRFVRGMVFEPIPRPAEVQSRVAAKDTPAAPADFEIGLEPR